MRVKAQLPDNGADLFRAARWSSLKPTSLASTRSAWIQQSAWMSRLNWPVSSLPIVNSDLPSLTAGARWLSTVQMTIARPRVVVAEGDAVLRDSLCQLISCLSVEVVGVSSGGELVLLLTDDRPVDLLIADTDLPWVSGLRVALSARSAGLDVPMILLSVSRDAQQQSKVAQLGSADLLPLLSSPDELLTLIRSRLFHPASSPRVLVTGAS